MPIVPYSSSGRLSIEYTVSTLFHRTRVPVALVLPLTSPVGFHTFNPSSGVTLASVAAQALWDLMRPNMGTTVPAASYLVEQNFGGVFVPVESGVLTGIGTSISPSQLTSQLTLTYKDTANQKLKFVLLEQAIPSPAHGAFPSGDAPLDALISAFLTRVALSDVGNWAHSRGDLGLNRFTFFTVSQNKRIRRERHLV